MKIIKTLALYIKALKFKRDVLKFEKEAKEISSKDISSDEFITHLNKGTKLEARSYEIEEELYNLKHNY
ncbi:hypothetical protein [Staphylococcus phage SpP]